jgi:hypothetical protein
MPGIAPADTLRKLVINYAGDGTVNEIYLSAGSVSAILTEQPDDRETCRRQKIADLIERYYTAYTVKDLDFIRTVFNPGILITKKRKHLPVKTDYRMISAEHYLRKLKYVFAANRHVIPEFKETEIRRHPQFSELYGVIIKHSWDTSTYKEAGYVFLVTDFANEDEPIVRNCTWQSESHEKMSNDEIFNLYMFNNITE